MSGEFDVFLVLLAGGFLISALYDLYRRVWFKRHQRNWTKHLGDALFCLGSSTLIVSILFYSNWGELRSYVFLGLGLGMLLYFKVVKVILTHSR